MLLYATLSVRRRKLNALRAIFSALFVRQSKHYSARKICKQYEYKRSSIDKISVNGRHFKALGALSHKHFDTFDIILQNSMF